MELDEVQAARELIRAIRGRRSQVALSRRLGYRSNVVYMWESGRRWPTAAETFRAAAACRIDVRAALAQWYRTPPPWLAEADLGTAHGVARFLRHELGTTPLVTVAARSGRNRFSVARWVKGAVEPRLPEFLRLVEAVSLRVVDLLVHLVGPDGVPSVAALWAQREARRTAVIDQPWSQAVLRALDVPALRTSPEALAAALDLDPEIAAACVAVLERAGLVRRTAAGSIEGVVTEALDTRRTEDTARRLKGFWAQVGTDRLSAGVPGAFAYNVFSASRSQLARLTELQQGYWRAARAVIAEDEPPEVVALLNLQLVRLDRDPIDPGGG